MTEKHMQCRDCGYKSKNLYVRVCPKCGDELIKVDDEDNDIGDEEDGL